MKSTLYLGLEIPYDLKKEGMIHYPIITIVPRDPKDDKIQYFFKAFDSCTHIAFTSKNGVTFFFQYAFLYGITISSIRKKHLIAVGKTTAKKICAYGAEASSVALQETAEGIIDLLKKENLQDARFLWPHSALARPVLKNWLQDSGIRFSDCIFYDTLPHAPLPLPNLMHFKEIIFTSPSTIDAFLRTFGSLPKNIILTCIGPVTQDHLFMQLDARRTLHRK